jgi:hypothetical protein
VPARRQRSASGAHAKRASASAATTHHFPRLVYSAAPPRSRGLACAVGARERHPARRLRRCRPHSRRAVRQARSEQPRAAHAGAAGPGLVARREVPANLIRQSATSTSGWRLSTQQRRAAAARRAPPLSISLPRHRAAACARPRAQPRRVSCAWRSAALPRRLPAQAHALGAHCRGAYLLRHCTRAFAATAAFQPLSLARVMGGQRKPGERPADEQPRAAPEGKPLVPRTAGRAAARDDDDGDATGGCCPFGKSSAEVSRLKKQLEAATRDKEQVRQWHCRAAAAACATIAYHNAPPPPSYPVPVAGGRSQAPERAADGARDSAGQGAQRAVHDDRREQPGIRVPPGACVRA